MKNAAAEHNFADGRNFTDELGLADGQSLEEPGGFEAALRELDEVVAALEAGRVSLEESLRLLQRGMALAAFCDKTLNQAEATLEQLVATPGGELVAQRVAWDDEDDEDDADENDAGADEIKDSQDDDEADEDD